jgi:hypothetical protein
VSLFLLAARHPWSALAVMFAPSILVSALFNKLPAPLQREGDRGVEQLETVIGHEIRSSGDVVVLEEELYP